MTNRIINKDPKIIGKCEQCPNFEESRLFGFVPAYCILQGRIIGITQTASAFRHQLVELYHPIPYWCELPEVKQ